MLIHNFVFFWAAEWGLFLLEVVSLLAYYYMLIFSYVQVISSPKE